MATSINKAEYQARAEEGSLYLAEQVASETPAASQLASVEVSAPKDTPPAPLLKTGSGTRLPVAKRPVGMIDLV